MAMEVFRAMEMALRGVKAKRRKWNTVNAHGTSTQVGDMIELLAVEKLFGLNDNLCMSSNKSAIIVTWELLEPPLKQYFSFKSLDRLKALTSNS